MITEQQFMQIIKDHKIEQELTLKRWVKTRNGYPDRVAKIFRNSKRKRKC